MLGLNRRVNVIQTDRGVDDSGAAAAEIETILYSNVQAAVQPHILNNLPPPGDRQVQAGIFYLKEFRIWLRRSDVPLKPLNTWIIQDVLTDEKYRVRATIDDAGRDHHWLVRAENFG